MGCGISMMVEVANDN